MIGILVATHGKMAEGIASAVEVIVGKVEQFDFLGLELEDDPETFGTEIASKVSELDKGEGVLILTDLLGATPMNQSALLLSENKNLGVITGVSLSMVISALFGREGVTLQTLLDTVIEESIDSIKDIRKLLELY